MHSTKFTFFVTAQPSIKTSTFVNGGSASDRNPSREEPDLDPGPAGRDRGNLQKGVFTKKPEDCFGALCAPRSDMAE